MGLYLLLVVLAIYMWFQVKVDSTFKSNISFNDNHGGFPREESNPGIHYCSALPARPFYSSMVTKENRAAGVLDNFAEGEKYSEHFLRKYVRNKTPEIMPSINSFFTDPK
ncbi:hypothetical protein Gorai_020548 [Gossypium raimondii]|uniref:Uncharacterized protein n=1 Tax=Gossypium raimondii TaxID=29730 RepID=A0A7J8NMP0_GOSRA|nr:hypothetical protein [Gossypium raimondii]